jgi:hypothetical protein
MEPEGSSQHLQEPATCPYPEPNQSSPCPTSQFLKTHFNIPAIYAWVFQVVSFPQFSPPKTCMHLSSPLYALHAPPISFFSIWSLEYLASRMELQFHPAPGCTRSSKLHKMYQCRLTAKNSWWWAERLPETCRVVIPINLEFSVSVGSIHKVMPSISANCISPVDICYMFRPYWPSSGIKYIIFKNQNKMHIYFEYARSHKLLWLKATGVSAFRRDFYDKHEELRSENVN